MSALRPVGRQFLGVLGVVVVTPRYDVIAFDFEDTHHLRSSDLASVGTLEPIQSFGKDAVSVGCNSKQLKLSIIDPDRLFYRFECRNCFIDAGRDRDTFIHPDGVRREPLMDGTSSMIFGELCTEGSYCFDWVRHFVGLSIYMVTLEIDAGQRFCDVPNLGEEASTHKAEPKPDTLSLLPDCLNPLCLGGRIVHILLVTDHLAPHIAIALHHAPPGLTKTPIPRLEIIVWQATKGKVPCP